MIFVNSMSDLFWEEVPDEVIKKHFYVMHEANHHTYQVLTKRPQRMCHFLRTVYPQHVAKGKFPQGYEHVWLGTSVENQTAANDRILHLQSTPATVRFLSVEPLIGPLDLRGMLHGIHWVVVGGESGPGSRPMHPRWVQSIRDACVEAGVAFFFKQWGGWVETHWDPNNPGPVKANERYLNLAGGHGFHGAGVIKIRRTSKHKAGRTLDGKEWGEMPARTCPSTP
jgi:protein gp37